jgi:hypothetical protein
LCFIFNAFITNQLLLHTRDLKSPHLNLS